MIAYFKDEIKKSKRKNKIHEMLTKIMKPFDTFATIATASTSATLSVIGIDWIVTQYHLEQHAV